MSYDAHEEASGSLIQETQDQSEKEGTEKAIMTGAKGYR